MLVVNPPSDVNPQTPDVPTAADELSELEVSVVMPCLNEADTLETCLTKARQALCEHKIRGEIIVADNASIDASSTIARRMGVQLITVEHRGYGNALMGGIAAARGKFIIIGDCDESYDFLEIPKFVDKLRQGYDLVQGCRLPSGGGKILTGAMPFLHRWLGNPLFSVLVRHMFAAPIHDVYCGMRGFTREHYLRLDQRCTGMEFATEMIIKSAIFGARVAEVPVTLHPDGRRSHPPHLRTFHDGWLTLRFLLVYSPRWLFLYPGIALVFLGLFGYFLAIPGAVIGGARLDAHTLLFASLAILLGYQSIAFAVFTKTFAIGERLLPSDPRLARLFEVVTLERGLLLGLGTFAIGIVLLLVAVNDWRLARFGPLDYPHTMRLVIPGVTLTALGFQTILSGFFISILRMRRH